MHSKLIQLSKDEKIYEYAELDLINNCCGNKTITVYSSVHTHTEYCVCASWIFAHAKQIKPLAYVEDNHISNVAISASKWLTHAHM